MALIQDTLTPDPDALLTRPQVGAALRAAGFPIADKTLATMASRARGGGPPFQKWGQKPLYEWRSALAWAHARLKPR